MIRAYRFLYSSSLFFIGTVLFLSASDPKLWFDASAADLFKRKSVSSKVPMGLFLAQQGKQVDFSSEVFLVTFDDTSKAVFKPVDAHDMRYAYAEVAAYKAACFLHFPIVPPTCMYQIDDQVGSLQLYVDTANSAQDGGRNFSDAGQENAYMIFCFVFGQWDLCSANRLVLFKDQKPYLIAIDNANCADRQRVQYGDHAFIRVWGIDSDDADEFPFDQAERIDNPSEDVLYQRFISMMPDYPSKRLAKRFSRKKRIIFVLNRQGLWVKCIDNEKAYAPVCSSEILDALKMLDESVVRSFFSDAPEGLFLDSFFADILQRRDQVVAYFAVNRSYIDFEAATNGVATKIASSLIE